MKWIKFVCLLLLFTTVLSLVSCNKKSALAAEEQGEVDKTMHASRSRELYDRVLGAFYTAYEEAKTAENVSVRYALMAIAEAKLLASGVMLPLSAGGGSYAISRVAPNTAAEVLWGNDALRRHSALVTTTPIKAVDRDAMKAQYNILKSKENGASEYLSWTKDFLRTKGYTLTDTYAMGYSGDPKTWDVLATSRTVDSQALVNTYDGLMEYDVANVLRPAMAESYSVSEDGRIYTFTLRRGAVWVDYEGKRLAEVTADDFVAGMQHMMDAAGGLEYLVQPIIAGADDYITGANKDFSRVGVKALNDYTVEYTLVEPTSYFLTMLGYGVFAPMNRAYFLSKGGAFGIDEYAAAAAGDGYLYGTTSEQIAYCGPYTVSNATAENTIVFDANESYWNRENINIKRIRWLYNDGTEATRAYNDMKAGTIAGSGLNESALKLSKTEKAPGSSKTWFEEYAYISQTDATTFSAFHNINRVIWSNASDATKVVSPQTVTEAEAAAKAMLNVHFRRALCFALNRGSYNAQAVGEELRFVSLRNTYTPGNFVKLTENITVKINGVDTAFEKGTAYGAIVQTQLDADGVGIKVWDPAADGGAGSSDGFDGWYSTDAAIRELDIAIEELKKEGVEIDREHPICLDLPTFIGSTTFINRCNAYKQSVETALGGMVKVNLVECPGSKEWYYAGYYTDYGYEANYNVYDVSGWGPDFGDPSTYLDTFLPEGDGYMIKCIGLY